MPSNRKLDSVLLFFSNYQRPVNTVEINNLFQDIEREELIMIIEKLRIDKYVILISKDLFKISFEGDWFIKSGGFTKKEFDDYMRLRAIRNASLGRILKKRRGDLYKRFVGAVKGWHIVNH